MKKTIITSALILGSAVASQAAVIAVLDGNDGSSVFDASNGGDSYSGDGSVVADAANYNATRAGMWNSTEYDFQQTATPGTATKQATYTFDGLIIGSQWEVYSSWVQEGNRATDAPYTIKGTTTVDMNQELKPNDLFLTDPKGNSIGFEKIGVATVDGAGKITVVLTNDANQWVINDAVAIKNVPEPSSAALLGLGGLALILRRRK
jgi:hypothetical protein